MYLNYEGQYCLWEGLKILVWEWKTPQIYCVKKIRTMETVTFSSRCAHVNMARSRYAHGKHRLLSRQGHGAPQYAHGSLTSSSWRVHDTFTVRTRSSHGQTKHSLRVLKRLWSWSYRACEVISKVNNTSDTQRRTSDLLLTAKWLSIWCKLCVTYLQGNYVYGRRSLIKFHHIFILSHPIVLQRSRWYEIKYNTTVRHNSI